MREIAEILGEGNLPTSWTFVSAPWGSPTVWPLAIPGLRSTISVGLVEKYIMSKCRQYCFRALDGGFRRGGGRMSVGKGTNVWQSFVAYFNYFLIAWIPAPSLCVFFRIGLQSLPIGGSRGEMFSGTEEGGRPKDGFHRCFLFLSSYQDCLLDAIRSPIVPRVARHPLLRGD